VWKLFLHGLKKWRQDRAERNAERAAENEGWESPRPEAVEGSEMNIALKGLAIILKLDFVQGYRRQIAAVCSLYLAAVVGGPDLVGLVPFDLPAALVGAAGAITGALNPFVAALTGWSGGTGFLLKNSPRLELRG